MAGALGAIGTGSASVLTSCAGGGESAAANKPLKEPGTYYIPELPDKATDGKELKAGVIGCGGRGSGAAENFLDAANGVTVVAVADTFKERVDALADKLKEKGCNIPEDKRFVGLDAYKQLIDSGVDVVIIATPPVFRPVHFQYAVSYTHLVILIFGIKFFLYMTYTLRITNYLLQNTLHLLQHFVTLGNISIHRIANLIIS